MFSYLFGAAFSLNCGMRALHCIALASLPHGMWDLSSPTRDWISPVLEGGRLIAGPPGRPWSISFVFLLSVLEQLPLPLCATTHLLPALGLTYGFWTSTDVNPSSFISCFHFDHNLRTVVKHFLGHRDTPRIKRSGGFHTLESRQSVPCICHQLDFHFYMSACHIS